MSFNGGAQISDNYYKRFVGILPKVLFFLLLKPVYSLSIYLTSVLEKQNSWFTEIFYLIT